MSGIFGLIHLDDSPVRAEDLQAMRSAMQEWGPDAGALWVRAQAGLGSLVRFDTPESPAEKLPVESPQGFALTAEARLDNRPELAAELGISPFEHASMPDGAFVLRAYEKWGSLAPRHLLGDWSFAAWHPRERRLFLARDHFGNTSMYYYMDEQRFAFASSRKALIALGIPRRLNEFFLACGLVSWTAHHGSQTIELDLHRLPPAHLLTLERRSLRTDQYWRLEDVPLLQLKQPQDYVEAFLPVFDRAVRERLRSRADLGVTLSGGLDSGSITALAARALKEQGRRLRAYTSVPVHDVTGTVDGNRFGDELPFAQATASFAGNVDLTEIRTTGITPIQGIRVAIQTHGEPGHAAGNVYWIIDLLATASADGLGTLLTGQGGNATISWTGMNRAHRLKLLARAGHWRAILKSFAYPLLPLPLIRRMRHLAYRDTLDWSNTAISPDFASRIGLGRQYIEASGTLTNPEEWLAPVQHRYAILKPGRSGLGALWAENSAAYGLDVRDPTLDTRVMELTLSIPDHVFNGRDGSDRWLIRAAMQGLMPDEVRLSRRRGRQAADLGNRLLDSAPEVEQALGEIEASRLAREYLSLERIRLTWEALCRDVNSQTTLQAVTILTRGIMAGLFLREFETVSS
jgi:asparagine synthase (glutamine-hydrolysing)